MTATWTLGTTIIPAPHGTIAWFVPGHPSNAAIEGPFPVLALGFSTEALTDADDNTMWGVENLRRSERADLEMNARFEFMSSFALLAGDFDEPWFEIGKEAFFTEKGARSRREANMRRTETQGENA